MNARDIYLFSQTDDRTSKYFKVCECNEKRIDYEHNKQRDEYDIISSVEKQSQVASSQVASITWLRCFTTGKFLN